MQPLVAHGLEARFLRALAALGVAAGARVLVAVSGGADSVALLRLFCAMREEQSFTLYAAHLDHGMRGQASQEDARFVSGLCQALDVPCILGARDVPSLAAQLKTGPEDAARQARYAFLEEARISVGARYVALAHHLEDQAETVLLRLLRGCGLAGLTGMRDSRGAYIRPLLGEHRQALRGYLRHMGQGWREDETNADPAYARNYVRVRAMPALKALNPNLAQALAGMAGRLAVDEDCLNRLAQELLQYKPMPYGLCLRAGPLRGAHEALRRRALMIAWGQLEGLERLQAHQVEALSALLDASAGANCNLPGDWHGLCGREHLHLLAPDSPDPPEPMPLRLEGETRWPGGLLRARPARPGELGDGKRTQVLDGDALQNAVVRFRQPGDRFRSLGAVGSQPLKQTLIDRGIDRPFRGLIPLVVGDGRVLWLIGLLPGGDAAVTLHTVRPIHFTYEGELPWEIGGKKNHA
ncbi:MAG: tRNA lysidine(34) synthetase TilS [Clostridia bacterium]|nr:tRNA lysidine(34) synthetase TilS [Clostridia bacterium]